MRCGVEGDTIRDKDELALWLVALLQTLGILVGADPDLVSMIDKLAFGLVELLEHGLALRGEHGGF